MEREIELNNRLIKFDNINQNRIYIHEYVMNKDNVEKEMVLVMGNCFHLCAYPNNFDSNKVEFEFDESHPLYIPLLNLLHGKEEIIIDDDNTLYENAKYMRIYKTDKIIIEFVNHLIDEEHRYDFDNFSIHINSIYPSMHSMVDRRDTRTKYYLCKYFEEAYDTLDEYQSKKTTRR